MSNDAYVPETDQPGRRWTWTDPDDERSEESTAVEESGVARLATWWAAWRARRRWRHEWTRPHLSPGDRDPYVEHRAILSMAPTGNHQPGTPPRQLRTDVDLAPADRSDDLLLETESSAVEDAA